MFKRAFITGITGQDGSYLAEFLIRKGYEVHGLVRKTSLKQRKRQNIFELTPLQHKKLFLHEGDLGKMKELVSLFRKIQPEEIYHLGAQSQVRESFESPGDTFDINAIATLRLLEEIRHSSDIIRFYHASTCEMYGRTEIFPQNEKTPFYPVSPYACAKVASHYLTACYRESYGLFACNGILFNHESPRRGESFVSRKIARGVAEIKRGNQKKLKLGNLEVQRDWGYAPEYVEAMWKMLQHDQADDYVIATGEAHAVKEFAEVAFASVGLNWQDYVEIDPQQIRPTEAGLLVGDASKAKRVLGWEPKVRFQELVRVMVEAEMNWGGG